MTRRTLLCHLAALPFVGTLFGREETELPQDSVHDFALPSGWVNVEDLPWQSSGVTWMIVAPPGFVPIKACEHISQRPTNGNLD